MLTAVLVISLVSLIVSGYVFYKLLPRGLKHESSILIDTSALIDGRILEVVKSGFIPAQIIIPRFVIAELQLLADKADHLKRERARYGLSVIKDLQDSRNTDVIISAQDVMEESGVDEKLVKLARRTGAMLFTTDFNLLKVAEIEGVRILNINELAQNLRPTRLPGEQAEIKVVAAGQERNQGVGYLEDGTLVVIEGAKNMRGKTVKIEFTRTLQTAAGRMMFAQSVREGRPANNHHVSQRPVPAKRRS